MARGLEEGNLRLRTLLDEAAMSNKGLARRIVDLAATQGLAGVRCDHTSQSCGGSRANNPARPSPSWPPKS